MDKISKVLISSGLTIKQVMEKLDESAEKILFVVDERMTLNGVITDGDVRRWIIKNGCLQETASVIMTQNPILLRPGYDFEKAKALMKTENIECIPIVDEGNRLVSALWWTDLFDDKKKSFGKIDAPVVIMAGGKGSRLEPFTKVLPKALIPIGDKSIIEIIINRFGEFGCRDFFISINYKGGMIKSYFGDSSFGYAVNFIEETSFSGTAGSLSMLKSSLKKTFFVNNCDILIEADYSNILEHHKKNGNVITMVCSMKNFKIPYGIVEADNGGALREIREKPEFNYLVNTGMYVMEPQALDFIPSGEMFHMTDLIGLLKSKNHKVGIYPVSEKSWNDMGQIEELYGMLKKFGNNK